MNGRFFNCIYLDDDIYFIFILNMINTTYPIKKKWNKIHGIPSTNDNMLNGNALAALIYHMTVIRNVLYWTL